MRTTDDARVSRSWFAIEGGWRDEGRASSRCVYKQCERASDGEYDIEGQTSRIE